MTLTKHQRDVLNYLATHCDKPNAVNLDSYGVGRLGGYRDRIQARTRKALFATGRLIRIKHPHRPGNAAYVHIAARRNSKWDTSRELD